jgi:hypothetical protein
VCGLDGEGRCPGATAPRVQMVPLAGESFAGGGGTRCLDIGAGPIRAVETAEVDRVLAPPVARRGRGVTASIVVEMSTASHHAALISVCEKSLPIKSKT